MSYDTDARADLAQALEYARSYKAERDANWRELDRLRTRLRALVPDVIEGGDLVAAIEAKLASDRSPATPTPTTPPRGEPVAEQIASLLPTLGTTPRARVTLAVAARVVREVFVNGRPLAEVVNLPAAPSPEAKPPHDHSGSYSAACEACNRAEAKPPAPAPISSVFAPYPPDADSLPDELPGAEAKPPATTRDEPDDLALCVCGHEHDLHGGPYGDGCCGFIPCECEAFTPAAPAPADPATPTKANEE